jgi:hypothetical protein
LRVALALHLYHPHMRDITFQPPRMARRSVWAPALKGRSAARVCWGLALAGWLGLCGAAGAQPAGQPQDIEKILQGAPTGTLTVKAVLVNGGTSSPVPGAQARVDLFHDGKAFKEYKVLLDEHGTAVLSGLPVVMGVAPLAIVEYKGLTYTEGGPTMDAANREASVEVKVYDTTEEAPAWRIPMRHVMVTPSASGVAVTEMVVTENPTDKTWLGLNPPDEKGNRTTVNLTLPKGAADVTLESGFHGWCCTSFEGGELKIKMPMMPGQKGFKFSYTVARDGGAGTPLSVASAAPVEHLMFLLPEDGTSVSPAPDSAELKAESAVQGGMAVRMFQCDALRTGQAAGLLISGAPTAGPRAGDSRAWPAQTWIGIGAGALVVGGLAVWRLRAMSAKPARAG